VRKNTSAKAQPRRATRAELKKLEREITEAIERLKEQEREIAEIMSRARIAQITVRSAMQNHRSRHVGLGVEQTAVRIK
jgi:predicted  nucleic acid-binding Zn-ribbon protein